MRAITSPRHVRVDIASLALLLVASYTLGLVTTVYDGENAGIVIGTKSCSLGVEWRGAPGIYGNCFGHNSDAELVNAYNEGWIEGEANAAAP
ncbi:hypothetical protein Q3V23_23360 [Streptomyces sp. VNUA116]|uniref:hypothetical protein n=1 Tax=Streptomyces sp. VNUA116 TaxID=3062449 RepID=UPI0026746404|nr:hypothetical protein [Streptomyces sp. VNUA116]WKU46763.1 hypothetical protein Q3V23_23360 [Streptomyces sp. VNUA116]